MLRLLKCAWLGVGVGAVAAVAITFGVDGMTAIGQRFGIGAALAAMFGVVGAVVGVVVALSTKPTRRV